MCAESHTRRSRPLDHLPTRTIFCDMKGIVGMSEIADAAKPYEQKWADE